MLKIYGELFLKDDVSEASVEMLFLGLIEDTKRVTEEKPNWIGRIHEHIHDRWSEEISLDDLATIAGVHRVTVSKNFSRYFGCTFGEYVRKIRIEKALHLIRTTNQSLTDIAVDCGFYDQSHFTRTFKSLTGLLPKYYAYL